MLVSGRTASWRSVRADDALRKVDAKLKEYDRQAGRTIREHSNGELRRVWSNRRRQADIFRSVRGHLLPRLTKSTEHTFRLEPASTCDGTESVPKL